MWKICFGICLSNTKVCFLYVFIEDWRQTWAGGRTPSAGGLYRFFQSLLRVYFDSIYAYDSRFLQIENNLLVLFFSKLLTERAGCFFRSACFSRCYFCLIVHSGKIRSNPLEWWYECWYVNNINNRWKCGDLMMDWVEVRFSFCFSRKTRCDGAKYSIFLYFFYLDLDVDSASMQLPEENPENH